jgi:hypothetical protein
MTDPHLGVMLLAHRRPWLLPLIVEQALSEFKAFVDITVDRPSSDVLEVVDKLAQQKNVRVFESPEPCLQPGASGDHFMTIRQFQLEKLQEKMPRYGVMWDDDHILESPQEGRYWMGRRFDLIYAKKRFLWDSVHKWNAKMPEHNSCFFFKMLEGDCYPSYETGRIIHAPVQVHDSPDSRKVEMKSYLLDMGYLWPEERERVFRAYAAAGKIDPATMPLVEEPDLRDVKREDRKGYWLKRIEKELGCLSRARTH